MMTYDVKCPFCGMINRNLYLEETDGWMECDQCKSVVRRNTFNQSMLISIIHMENRKEVASAT